jgi:phage tail-like protein
MSLSGRHDPLAAFNFRVEIDGSAVAGFTECSGLESETDVIQYREGGDARIRLIPGQTTYSAITLKRGFVVDRSLWEWRQQVVTGQAFRRNVSIVLMNEARQEVARWNLADAWPSKWHGPDLNGRASDVAIETLEIVHEGLDWQT